MQSIIALRFHGRHGFTHRTNKTCPSSLPSTADSDTVINTLMGMHFNVFLLKDNTSENIEQLEGIQRESIEAGKNQPHQDISILYSS